MDRVALVESWLREERQPFTVWDFSHLDGRMAADGERWSYMDRAADLEFFAAKFLIEAIKG